MDYTVYILRCADGSYYTGVTNDLARRVFEHEQCTDPKSYVFKRRPLKLVYSANFEDINEAISWEKTIKRWSRKKKEALIKGDEEALKQLSKRYTRYIPKRHPPVSP
jgi:putative endonuclease